MFCCFYGSRKEKKEGGSIILVEVLSRWWSGCICVSNRSSLAWNHRGEGVRRPFISTIYKNVRSSQRILKSLRTLTAWLLSAVIDYTGYLQLILNCHHAAVLSGLLLLSLPVFGRKGQSSAGCLWLINMAESNPPTDCKGNDPSVWELPFPEGEPEICSQTF